MSIVTYRSGWNDALKYVLEHIEDVPKINYIKYIINKELSEENNQHETENRRQNLLPKRWYILR